jgi:hypothetical protein
VVFEVFETDSQSRRTTYPLWLRFFTFIVAFVAAFILLGPSFLFSSSDPLLPWNEESRILPSGQTSQARPSADQPQLTRVLRYKTQAERDGYQCGTVNFIIYPDGTVKGIWNGEYDQPDDVHHLIMAASFTGNIDPAKPCIEGDTHYASKLYFITAGSFTLVETRLPAGQSRDICGSIYVRGWLDPNYVAAGELIITENKRSFDAFRWKAEPGN